MKSFSENDFEATGEWTYFVVDEVSSFEYRLQTEGYIERDTGAWICTDYEFEIRNVEGNVDTEALDKLDFKD